MNFAVLAPGERVDSERIVNEYGPAIMTAMHASVDRHLEYGDDPQGYEDEPAAWSGPEPGTSDSIQLRQSITRSATGMFLGVAGKLDDMDDEELDASDSDSNPSVPTHRGTVSWEEHADKTQDEMAAEAELADLKRSRPKRGEAKFRLRDLMRRFPQTEAANKARRMLERLESGQ